MTRGGIEYNLPKSPYTIKLNNFTFYFSSRVYKEKYESALANYTNDFRLTLEKKLSVSVTGVEDIASILLYKRTEKRGFFATYEKDSNTLKWNNIDEMFFDLGLTKVNKKGIARSD